MTKEQMQFIKGKEDFTKIEKIYCDNDIIITPSSECLITWDDTNELLIINVKKTYDAINYNVRDIRIYQMYTDIQYISFYK